MSNLRYDYLEYVKPINIAPLWASWTAISTAAALMERRCYISMGHGSLLFPNMFVSIIGYAGDGKNFAVNSMLSILREYNRQLPSDDDRLQFGPSIITPAALVKELHESKRQIGAFEQSALYICNPELALTFNNIGGGEVASDLLDYYDCPDFKRKRTISGGKVELENVCVNICGAITPTKLPQMFPVHTAGDGLASRFIFVPVFDPPDKLPFFPPQDKGLRARIINHLARIHGMAGEFKMDNEAVATYTEWFLERNKRLKETTAPGSLERSLLTRQPDMVRKVAMVLSAMRRSDRIIEETDMIQSINLIEMLAKPTLDCFSATDAKRISNFGYQLLEAIPFKRTPQSEILQTLVSSGVIPNTKEVEEQFQFFVAADMVEVDFDNHIKYYRRKV